jgi:hypothetical protein
MKHELVVSLLLAIGVSNPAIGGEQSIRLAQNPPTTFDCINNCNSQNALCTSQCPASGVLSQNQPDINAGQLVLPPGTSGRVSDIQNNQPIQCRLNCTTQQQSCYATCR